MLYFGWRAKVEAIYREYAQQRQAPPDDEVVQDLAWRALEQDNEPSG